MPTTDGYTVVAYLRPKPGSAEKLLAIRDRLIDEFRRDLDGFVSATLYRVDGSDEWRDVVVFSDRAAIDNPAQGPAYKEWDSMVDLLEYEILERIAHEA